MAKTALSHEERRAMVRQALNQGRGDGLPGRYIDTMYDDSVVYRESDAMHQAPYKIDGDSVTIGTPTPVRSKTSFVPIVVAASEFSLDVGVDTGNNVLRYSGVVFEAGDYPDKGVSFSESDLDRIVQTFSGPVALDSEHRPSIFKVGDLGRLESIKRVGKQLIGDLSIPMWLRGVVGKSVGVSLAFSESKDVIGCALTWNPRISSARVAAAFSEFTGSQAGSGPRSKAVNGQVKMSLIDKIKALLADGDAADDGPVFSAEVGKALESENARLRKEVETLKAGQTIKFAADVAVDPRTAMEASRMVEDLIREGRVAPTAREKVVALFTAVLHEDTVQGKLTFSANKFVGPRLDVLREAFGALPSILPTETKTGGEVHVFTHGGGGSDDGKGVKIDAKAYLKAAQGGGN